MFLTWSLFQRPNRVKLAHRSRPVRRRDISRLVLAAIYLVAGILHLATPDPFLLITPNWVPFPRHVILVTAVLQSVRDLLHYSEETHRPLASEILAEILATLEQRPSSGLS